MALQKHFESDCALDDHRRDRRTRGVFPNGQYLVQARKSRGLTQEQLAGIADVDVKTIRKGEAAKRLDLATLERITFALGLELPKILDNPPVARNDHFLIVKGWQLAWQRQALQRILNCYAVNACVVLPGAPPLPFSGRHAGHAAIAQVCERAWGSFISQPCKDSNFFVAERPDQVVLRCSNQICADRRPGIQLTSTHFFQIKDLKIVEHHLEYDTLMMSQLLQ